jgi:hypothetical protein
VIYLPETVKAQLREELKQEVLEQAKREGWATPNAIPEWLARIRLSGDVRLRYEADLFGAGNANGGEFPDFNAINTGKPFDVNFVDVANERYLNVDRDRYRPRLRARLAVGADVGSGFTAGVRVASGDGSTPVSTNQTVGTNFSKYSIWLDQAFLQWEPLRRPTGSLAVLLGRFANPFFTTDLTWYADINLDGLALRGQMATGAGLSPFLVAGAFPVFTGAFAFPPEQPAKFGSLNKWLLAAQIGTDWKIGGAVLLKLGAAYYGFEGIQGRVSDPCDTHLSYASCDTDESRPAFAQKGNTYMALRTPSQAALAAEASGLAPRYQYFGLASRFREAVLTGRLEVLAAPPLKVAIDGEVVRNLGFSAEQVSAVALNNLAPCDPSGNCSRFAGGRDAYVARLTLGSPTQGGPWAWSVWLTYRWVQSDAVVDAFDDPDFGLGGTNLKGYALAGSVGLAKGVYLSVRLMSANAVAGPPYRVDVFQVDLGAGF